MQIVPTGELMEIYEETKDGWWVYTSKFINIRSLIIGLGISSILVIVFFSLRFIDGFMSLPYIIQLFIFDDIGLLMGFLTVFITSFLFLKRLFGRTTIIDIHGTMENYYVIEKAIETSIINNECKYKKEDWTGKQKGVSFILSKMKLVIRLSHFDRQKYKNIIHIAMMNITAKNIPVVDEIKFNIENIMRTYDCRRYNEYPWLIQLF
jgi:hypothetical protein